MPTVLLKYHGNLSTVVIYLVPVVTCLDVYFWPGFNFLVPILAALNHRVNSHFKSFFVKFCVLHYSPVLLNPRLSAPWLHLLSERRPCQQRGALGLRPWLSSYRQRHSNLSPHITRLPCMELSYSRVSRFVFLRMGTCVRERNIRLNVT